MECLKCGKHFPIPGDLAKPSGAFARIETEKTVWEYIKRYINR